MPFKRRAKINYIYDACMKYDDAINYKYWIFNTVEQ
jgi:hypothetical protein